MKFKVLNEFKHGFTTFEAGNSHDSEVLGITDDLVNVFHRAGWVELDGEESNSLNPSHQEVIADNVIHNAEISDNG